MLFNFTSSMFSKLILIFFLKEVVDTNWHFPIHCILIVVVQVIGSAPPRKSFGSFL